MKLVSHNNYNSKKSVQHKKIIMKNLLFNPVNVFHCYRVVCATTFESFMTADVDVVQKFEHLLQCSGTNGIGGNFGHKRSHLQVVCHLREEHDKMRSHFTTDRWLIEHQNRYDNRYEK